MVRWSGGKGTSNFLTYSRETEPVNTVSPKNIWQDKEMILAQAVILERKRF
jgi:hypothetical protein